MKRQTLLNHHKPNPPPNTPPETRFRVAIGLALSAAIHAAVFALIHLHRTFTPPKTKEPVIVDFVEPGRSNVKDGFETTSEPRRSSDRADEKSRSSRNSSHDDIAKFVPSFRPNFNSLGENVEAPQQSESNSPNTSGFGSAPHQEAYRFSESLDLQGTLDALPFFEAVWKKIDRSLDFPDEFVKQRRSGTVTIQFEIDNQGRFTGKVYDVRSEEPLLATYALVVLIQSLRTPVHSRVWLDRPNVALEATFLFKTYPYPDGIPARKNAQPFKNYLAFDRHAYAEPWIVEKIDRFVAKYVPPVIPIPGGVYIDFVQAYKMYKAWTEPDLTDVRKQRMDTLVERLRAEIDRAENTKKQSSPSSETPSS